jgi:hypothetical protein
MIKHFLNQKPNASGHYAIKEKMMHTLKFFAERALYWFGNTPTSQIIPSHDFIL